MGLTETTRPERTELYGNTDGEARQHVKIVIDGVEVLSYSVPNGTTASLNILVTGELKRL